MAVRRPFYWDGESLREYTDEQIAYIRYRLRKEYAYRLFSSHYNSGGNGQVPGGIDVGQQTISGSWNTIATISQAYRNFGYATSSTNPIPSATLTALDSNNSTNTITFNQNYYYWNPATVTTTVPTSTDFDTYGYIVWNYSTNSFEIETNETNIQDTFINTTVSELTSTGGDYPDEIGSWRISKVSPGEGWALVDHQFFLNYYYYYNEHPNINETLSVYNAPRMYKEQYHLWLRLDSSYGEQPAGNQPMLGLKQGLWPYNENIGLQERVTKELISNILYPMLLRRLEGNLVYSFKTQAEITAASIPEASKRGIFNYHSSALTGTTNTDVVQYYARHRYFAVAHPIGYTSNDEKFLVITA